MACAVKEDTVLDCRTIVITSGKGGVGKTTTTANLAAALASDGYKVVAVDGDVGLRNLDVIMGLENRIVYTLIDVIEGNCRLNQALIRTPSPRSRWKSSARSCVPTSISYS